MSNSEDPYPWNSTQTLKIQVIAEEFRSAGKLLEAEILERVANMLAAYGDRDSDYTSMYIEGLAAISHIEDYIS